MKILQIVVFIFCIQSLCFSQNSDAAFTKVYQRINSVKMLDMDKTSPDYSKDSLEVLEINQLLSFLNNFLNSEHKLNGSANFNFAGNENDVTSLFKIGVGASIDHGLYPYELDLSTNIQTVIQNGTFQENISDVDISFDFHPITPGVDAKNDGLWLENYVMVKRFNDGFLGIEQRYEAGFGVILNWFSNKLTNNGTANATSLDAKPTYNVHGDDLVRCLESCYNKKSILNLSAAETGTLSYTRERFKRGNKKKFSKLRLALLAGVYYEIEQARAQNTILFNGKDSTFNELFDATNKLRLAIRPTLSWKPKDGYTLKIYPYFKLPVGNIYDTVREGNLEDRRIDYFLDIQTSFKINIESNFAISIFYRLLYDNAPKRKYLQQNDGSFVLLSGQERHSNFGVSLNFGF